MAKKPKKQAEKTQKSVYMSYENWDKVNKMAAPFKQSISNVIEILVEKA